LIELEEGVITPVEELIVNPAGVEENVPPATPVIVGVAVPPATHNVLEG
jgi:hypothetical protein